ncbi:dimethylarginine dimethylaminohydrolase family protein [Pseudobacillus sp. FSL P4-0506]|uniref:dimethylarginine dimethylaminohydrolase family protein n=1 Tax=unclassified Pseudobacillus TaxID=2619284 RepID=UPI0030F857A2
MTLASRQSEPVTCGSEYERLHKVLLCQPRYMAIKEVINETQEQFKEENIQVKRALKQHQRFSRLLQEHGVEVIELQPQADYPEQVFTRDIGFTIGGQVFIAGMATDIRQGEEAVLKNWLQQEGLPHFQLSSGPVEGGDIIVNGRTVYAGISSRTNEQAITELQSQLPDYEIVPIPFDEKYLHLDCVFNILSPEEALVFPKALGEQERQLLESRFRLIEVSEEEQFTLGTNVLSIGNKKVFSLPVNKRVNQQLAERGYKVIEVDITEIIKSGGSFRCCTMPLLRG